jgi:hypothetical protein
MRLRNENMGVAVGLLIVIVGQMLTGGNPTEAEATLMTILGVGALLSVSYSLNERDRRRGVPQTSPFRRSGSDGEGPG